MRPGESLMFWCLKAVLFPLRTRGLACSFPAGQNHAPASRHTQVLLPESEQRPCPCPDGPSHATCRSRGDASALRPLDPVTCPLLPDHTDRGLAAGPVPATPRENPAGCTARECPRRALSSGLWAAPGNPPQLQLIMHPVLCDCPSRSEVLRAGHLLNRKPPGTRNGPQTWRQR